MRTYNCRATRIADKIHIYSHLAATPGYLGEGIELHELLILPFIVYDTG